MADPPIDVKIQLGKGFADLNKKLKGAEKSLRTELNKAIRDSTKPAVADLKAAVMAIDSKVTGKSGVGSGEVSRAIHAGSGKIQRKRSHGLRATIARSIQTKITTSGSRTGVRIRIDGTKLPADQQKLPKALDSANGWRHPVFGNKSVWVTQKGQPWWAVTVNKHRDDIRAKIRAAIDSTVSKL